MPRSGTQNGPLSSTLAVACGEREVEQAQLRVYMAASRDFAGDADAMGKRLTSESVRIVSKWHLNETKLVDPASHLVRQDILAANLADLTGCDVVVALMDRGAPRATYAEIGYALAAGHWVIWVKPEEGAEDYRACIFDAHPFVRRVRSEKEIVDTLGKIKEGMFRTEGGSIVPPSWVQDAVRLLASVDARYRLALSEFGGLAGFSTQFAKATEAMRYVAKRAMTIPGPTHEAIEWYFAVLDMMAFARLSAESADSTSSKDIN